ncbi:MAG: hypothetical protein ABIW38_06935 [Ferruginibacter sp.]
MIKSIDKQKVLDICLQKQEEQVENFKSRVLSIKSDINDKTYSASQSEDRKAGKTEMLRIYEKELVFSTADLDYLKSLNPSIEYPTVQPGALVVTKELMFFVAISTEKFEIEGKTAVGISVNAPIYKTMMGLAKGESFQFNQSEYLIEELY